jgi:hypothetical protein
MEGYAMIELAIEIFIGYWIIMKLLGAAYHAGTEEQRKREEWDNYWKGRR